MTSDRKKPPGRVLEYGEWFVVPRGDREWNYVVEDPCQSQEGQWYCVQHDAFTPYQQHAEMHNTPQCRWVWVCRRHLAGGVVETVKTRRRR